MIVLITCENPHINGRHRFSYVYFIFKTQRVKYAREEEDVIITSDPANVLCYFPFFFKLIIFIHYNLGLIYFPIIKKPWGLMSVKRSWVK